MKIEIGQIVKTGRRTRGFVCGFLQDLYNPNIIWVYIHRIIGGKNKRFDGGFQIFNKDLLERMN